MKNQAGIITTNKALVVMTLILGEEQCRKCSRMVKEVGIYGGITIIGKGTVNNAVLKLLGIKDQKKEIINFLISKERSGELIDHFTKELGLAEPGKGIIYITPVIYASLTENGRQVIVKTIEDEDNKDMFKKLTVIVDRGMAVDVMDIALKAGVRGGTIMHGRGTGAEHTTTLFGMQIEPEKELVIILMPTGLVDKVVDDLYRELKLDDPGNGILFVEPVLGVRGLLDLEDSKTE
ncbi:MAG: P-II family nitrogen regulator [Clostridiales bacterium]|jgi:nitrogen regulatory protein PII|nr:P-II family nitrogen regulator [Clostridiales bacterium]